MRRGVDAISCWLARIRMAYNIHNIQWENLCDDTMSNYVRLTFDVLEFGAPSFFYPQEIQYKRTVYTV